MNTDYLFTFSIKLLKTLILVLLSCGIAHSQIEFSGNFEELFQDFTADSYSDNPLPGGLNSSDWVIEGFSTDNDRTRGVTLGGVSTGGLYSLDHPTHEGAIWIQPGESDFTPGTITLKLVNKSGEEINNLKVSFDILHLNDQNRSSSIEFLHSPDNVSYVHHPDLDFVSEEARDAAPSIKLHSASLDITGLSIQPDAIFAIRWKMDDAAGSGSRDEIGLDNIRLTSSSSPDPCVDHPWDGSHSAISPLTLNEDLAPGTVRINEFHYDDEGADQNEFVEILAVAPFPTDVEDYMVILYEGDDGTENHTTRLGDISFTEINGNRYYVWERSLEQGPDGIALIDDSGDPLEFFSYEGSFAATDGPAAGVTSIDIPLEESGETPDDSSIQRFGNRFVLTAGMNTKENPNAISDLDALASCQGITENGMYAIHIQNFQPNVEYAIDYDGDNHPDEIFNASSASIISNTILEFTDGTAHPAIQIDAFYDGAFVPDQTIEIHEILCRDIDGDGIQDQNTSLCNTQNLANGAEIISQAAPYADSEHNYLYIITKDDLIVDKNFSGHFIILESNTDYTVYAYRIVVTESTDFSNNFQIGQMLPMPDPGVYDFTFCNTNGVEYTTPDCDLCPAFNTMFPIVSDTSICFSESVLNLDVDYVSRIQLTTEYTFGGEVTSAINVSDFLKASEVAVGSGLSTISFAGSETAYSARNWDESDSRNDADYYEFCVTTTNGFELALSQLSLRLRRSGTGPEYIEIRTSTDEFATSSSLHLDTLITPSEYQELNITGSSDPVSQQLCFRVYGYGAESPSGTLRIDDIELEFDESPANTVYAVYDRDPQFGGNLITRGSTPVIPSDQIQKNRAMFVIAEFNGCVSETVFFYPTVQEAVALGCQDDIQISIAECEYEVPVNALLEGDNLDLYDIEITHAKTGQIVENGVITIADVGESFKFKVTNPCDGNSCWGQFFVENKIVPEFQSPCAAELGYDIEETLDLDPTTASTSIAFQLDNTCHNLQVTLDESLKLFDETGAWINPDLKLVLIDPAGNKISAANFQSPTVYTAIDDTLFFTTDHIELSTIAPLSQTGEYELQLFAQKGKGEGKVRSELHVLDCLPDPSCMRYCGTDLDPMGGYVTEDDLLEMLENNCSAEVTNITADTIPRDNICDGSGSFFFVRYLGEVNIKGQKETIELLRQGYLESPIPLAEIEFPENVEIDCFSPWQPNNLYDHFVDSLNPSSLQLALEKSYPYFDTKKMEPYLYYYDSLVTTYEYFETTETVLINDVWVVITKEDSIRQDTFLQKTIPDTVLIPALIRLEENKVCNIITTVSDDVRSGCGNGQKIFRTWMVTNWCDGKQESHTQLIETKEEREFPFEFAGDTIISVSPWTCAATLTLPKLMLPDDFCGGEINYTYQSMKGTVVGGRVIDLELEDLMDTIQMTARDECGNTVRDELYIRIVDRVSPIPVCPDKITVGLSQFDNGGIPASVFDIGSHDAGCDNQVYVKVIRDDDLMNSEHGFWNSRGPNRTPVYTLPPDPVFFPPYSCENSNGDDYIDDIYLTIFGNVIGFSLSLNQVFFDDRVEVCCDDMNKEIDVTVRVFDIDPGTGPIDPRRMVNDRVNSGIRVRNAAGNLVTSNNQLDNDLFGHYNECNVKIFVQENSQPTLICEDQSVSCDDYTEKVFAPSLSGLYCESALLILDATEAIKDGCEGNGEIQEWYYDENENGTREPSEPSCRQTISIENNTSGFDPMTIRWPKHYDGSVLKGVTIECNSDGESFEKEAFVPMGEFSECTFTDSLDSPQYCAPQCGLVATQVKVDTIESSTACYTIVKNWTVIDWCTYEANGSSNTDANDQTIGVEDWASGTCQFCEDSLTYLTPGTYVKYSRVERDGYYTYKQIISVLDRTAPRIAVDTLVEIPIYDGKESKEDDKTCTAESTIRAVAFDTCEDDEVSSEVFWEVIISDQDGNQLESIHHRGNDIEVSTGLGLSNEVRYITWTITDLCGNRSQTTTKILFKDRKAPTPVCIATLAINSENTIPALIWAKDFDRGSFDNCSDSLDFTLTFHDEEPIKPGEEGFEDQRSYTITCDLLVNANVEQLNLYVWDECGNYDHCAVAVLYNKADTICDSLNIKDTLFSVGGSVNSFNGVPVSPVTIQVQSNAAEYPRHLDNKSDGQYTFPNMESGYDYIIDASKENSDEGLSALDALLIERHLLEIKSFQNMESFVAADINGDGSISTLDVILLKRRLLQITDDFNGMNDWIFLPNSDSLKYGEYSNDIDYKYTFEKLDESRSQVDFTAIKRGDVNHSYDREIDVRSIEYMTLGDAQVHSGSFVYPVLFEQSFHALELDMDVDSNVEIEILSGGLGEEHLDYLQTGEQIKMIATNPYQLETDDEEAYFYIRTNKELSPDALKVHGTVYYSDDAPNMIILQGTGSQYTLFQNIPNPFTKYTQIPVVAPSSGEVTLLIHNQLGAEIMRKTFQLVKGKNFINLGDDLQLEAGIYYYSLEDEMYAKPYKLIKLD